MKRKWHVRTQWCTETDSDFDSALDDVVSLTNARVDRRSQHADLQVERCIIEAARANQCADEHKQFMESVYGVR